MGARIPAIGTRYAAKVERCKAIAQLFAKFESIFAAFILSPP